MEYLIGALGSALFFSCIITAYVLGRQSARPKPKPVDEETRRRAEELKKHFQELMNYDVTTALKGRR